MIRFMGFVTGAAVAIGTMLFLFGVPELPGEAPAPVEPRAETAATTIPAAAPLATTETAPEPAPVGSEPPPAPPEQEMSPPELVQNVPAEPLPPAVTDDAPPPEIVETGQPQAPIAVAEDAPPRELRWHAFWSPFASQIAANGFVSRLEAVTGFDYRVVKIENGVYEVAFGYSSDDERLAKLQAIESATGLEMPDS